MRITTKGQVTIPILVRHRLGLLPDTEVDFIVEGNTARIVKVESSTRESRGERLLRHLRGSASTGMTTEEILALTREP